MATEQQELAGASRLPTKDDHRVLPGTSFLDPGSKYFLRRVFRAEEHPRDCAGLPILIQAHVTKEDRRRHRKRVCHETSYRHRKVICSFDAQCRMPALPLDTPPCLWILASRAKHLQEVGTF